MKFFNIDCHISVIADIQYIFKKLGHQVDDWCVSGHHWVMGKPLANIPLNNGGKIEGCAWIDKPTADSFYETYKDKLSHYDGFICCYPVEYCLLYEKFNKPVIIVNCVRYEHPFTREPERWKYTNECLLRLNERGLLHFVCNNKGDLWYSNYFLPQIQKTWIPNLCEYVNQSYNCTINKYLIHTRSKVQGVPSHLIDKLGGRYSWSDVYKRKGVIHVPYHNGSMSIFEHYTGNMPMFIPSKKFGKELLKQNRMFDDLTFYKIYKMNEPSEKENPNCLSNESNIDKWFDTCDFYDPENMPHIVYFDSWDHLKVLLETTNTQEISNKMKDYNIIRKEMVYSKWKNILNKIK